MIFPLLAFLFIVSFDSLRKNLKKILVFCAIDAVWVIVYLFKISGRMTQLETSFYHKPQLLNPLYQIPIAITSYLELMFWPKGLTLYHSEMTFSLIEYAVRLITFIIFIALIIFSFKRDRQVFFWLSFFVASLLTFLTPLGISWVVAERYVYLAAIGVFVVIALIIKRVTEVKRFKIAVNILFFLIIGALLLRTFVRNIEWRNEDNLWFSTAKNSPSSPNTHNNLGDVYSRWGDLEKAASEFMLAIRIKPGYADAYHNLAHTYQKMGKLKAAEENYLNAIKYNPNLWQSYQNLAGIYYRQGKFALARENMEKARAINPKDSQLHTNLGVVYLALGEKEKARQSFQQALSLEPHNQIAKNGLQLLDSPK
jgi:tetratricopeptide (TPR) repeat protein